MNGKELRSREQGETKEGFAVRAHDASFEIRRKVLTGMDVLISGFWLGIPSRDQLHQVDQRFFEKDRSYYTYRHNEQGLFQWEQDVVDTYFTDVRRIILIGAGGGREVLALSREGRVVDGFECNPELAGFANSFLAAQGVDSTVTVCNRDVCPDIDKVYEGAILGWGSYMLVQGRQRRIELLKQISRRLEINSPILLSFYARTGSQRKYKAVARMASMFRTVLRRERVEVGDMLWPNYVHYFSKEQIIDELESSGYAVKWLGLKPYGHAVGVKK